MVIYNTVRLSYLHITPQTRSGLGYVCLVSSIALSCMQGQSSWAWPGLEESSYSLKNFFKFLEEVYMPDFGDIAVYMDRHYGSGYFPYYGLSNLGYYI